MALIAFETPPGFAPAALQQALRALSAPSLALCADRLPTETTGEASPVADALQFACKLLTADAARRSVDVMQSCDGDAAVCCERRALRQIVHALGSDAIQLAEAGSEITITARNLKGAVLLRVGPFGSGPGTALRERTAVLTAAGLVADAGGTLLCEHGPDGGRISVRLPRACTGAHHHPMQPIGGAA